MSPMWEVAKTPRALTVGELLATLRLLPKDVRVAALYDCGCAEGDVVQIAIDDARESVVLLVA